MQDGQDTLSYSECVDVVYGAGLTTVRGEMQFPSENIVQGEPAPGAGSATVGSDFLHRGDPSDDNLQNTVAGRPTAPKTARTEAAPDTVSVQEGSPLTAQLSQNGTVQRKLLFVKPVPRPLMEIAAPNTKLQDAVTQSRKTATPASRKSARIASRGANTQTIEEQATALLMKKSGFLQQGKTPDPKTSEKFRDQFVVPLEQQVVGELREAFGLGDGL